MNDRLIEYQFEMRAKSAQVWGAITLHRTRTGVSLREFTRRCGLQERALEKYAMGSASYLNKTALEKVQTYLDGQK